MEITIKREVKTPNSTISSLAVDGKFMCYVLEDTDRGLKQDMNLQIIKEKKVYGKTAIPAGRYKVVITMSNRFKRELPLLLNVPGYEGVRIHPGNTAENTEGCLLPGITKAQDFVGNSRAAFSAIFAAIKKAISAGQEVYLTIG